MIMKDEQGDVGPVNSEGGAEFYLSVNLGSESETLLESMESEYQVDESFGEEIMVEIVGSDVFVDGVSGEKDGGFVWGESGDMGSHVVENVEEIETRNVPEAMDVSNQGVENKLGESEVELSAFRGDQNCVVSEELEVRHSDSVDSEGGAVFEQSWRKVGVSGEEASNTGIEAMAVSSSDMKTEEAVGRTSVVVNEAAVQDETVDNSTNSANLVTPELQVDQVVDSVEVCSTLRKETLHSGDNAACQDWLGADSVTSCVETSSFNGDHVDRPEISVNSNSEGLDTAQVDGRVGELNFFDAGAVSPVDHNHIDSSLSVTVNCTISAPDIAPPPFSGFETLTAENFKNGVHGTNAESISPNVDFGIDVKIVDVEEVHAAEGKDSILKLDALYSDVQDENHDCSKELSGVKCEATRGVNDTSHASQESVHGKSLASERVEVMGMDLDDILDFQAGASDINSLSCIGDYERLKNDGDLEAGAVPKNHVLPTEPTLQADDGDTAEINKDKGIMIETCAGIEENPPHTTHTCPSLDKKIVQADSATYVDPPHFATSVAEVMNDQYIATYQVDAVDAVGSINQDDGIDKIAVPSFEYQEIAKSPALDVSTGDMCLAENGVCSKVETVDVVMAENHVACNDPVLTVEIGPDNPAEECGSSQSKEPAFFVQKTETTNDGVHVTELHVSSTNISSFDGASIEDTCMVDVAISEDEANKSLEAEDNARKIYSNHTAEGNTPETKPMDVEEEREFDQGKEVECREAELGLKKSASETDKSNMSDEFPVKSMSSLGINQLGYLAAPKNDGQFALSDLVWGKVRSHPWWPGQIFDPSDASEKAVKYYKKDSYLVAYFGDRTFAWNDEYLLKPFRSHFSQIEKQSNSEGFQNAVTCALEEVSRRVELGLACSCIPKDAYDDIESQVVVNTGIREESSRRYGVDQSSRAASFEPDKLLNFVRGLAPNASSGADWLDLVIAQAQISAFCRFKGYRLPTGIASSTKLLGNDANVAQNSDENVASHKRKHIPKDSLQSRKKERSLTELMGGAAYSADFEDKSGAKDLSRSYGKKQKALDPLDDGSDKRVNIYAAIVSTLTNQAPKPSFKIGECIRRVASQLTGSASMVKGHNDEMGINGSPRINVLPRRQSMFVSAESFSLNEMLSQLQLVAQDPKKGHDFLNTIVTFFSGFRSSVAVNKRGRKKKSDKTISGCAEEFEFDDVNDSYWTDKIVQNYSEEQLLHSNENGTGNLQLVPFDAEKPVKSGRKSHSRKRYFRENSPTAASMQSDENVKRRKQEASPAELILNFAERASIPSEINLNKMFRRFGPLMESETEVDHDSGRAKVIFKQGSDAEVAHNSAEKFNVFGAVLVNYQIGYSPLISVKISSLAIPQFQEDVALML